MKPPTKKDIPKVSTSRVKAWNYSACKFPRTYSTITNKFIKMKTKCETKCSLDRITEKLTNVIYIAKIDPSV